MTTNTIKIHNVETGEVIERDMTKEELSDLENLAVSFEAQELAAQLEKEKNYKARAEILKRLGLTEAEAALLIS